MRWVRTSVVLAALMALAGGSWLAWRSSRNAAERDRALQLAQKGQFKAAEPLLLKCLDREPDNVRILRTLAIGYQAEGHVARVGTYLARWCELDPGSAEAHTARFEFFFSTHEWERAREEAERVLQLQSDNHKVKENLLRALEQSGRFAEAEDACRRLLDQRPGDPLLLYHLAEAYRLQGKSEQSAAVLDELLPRMPLGSRAGFLALRGTLYCEAGQYENAVPVLQKALALEPGNDQAWYQLLLALSRLGKTSEAEQQLEQFLAKLDVRLLARDLSALSANARLQLRMADHLLKKGRTEDGVRILRRVLAEDPDNRDALELRKKYEKQ
jgi:predicted Zn-dependent protease